MVKDQLLFYICNKGEFGKSKIVHKIELRYIILLYKDFNLIITVITSAIIDNINNNNIYLNFVIDIENRHKKSNIRLNLWIA